jgi:Uncharacterized protein conserved in bacteria (DUF2188)
MNKIIFKIVKRDDGWVYEANGALSQHFRTREAARKAARSAASAAGETTPLSHENKGEWYDDTG